MKKQNPLRNIVIASFLAFGFAANSFAVPPCQNFPRGEGPGVGHGMGPRHGGDSRHGMPHFSGMSRLYEELKLDEKQEALWKEAEQFFIDHRKAMAERFRKHYSEAKGMFDQAGTDLRSILKHRDEFRSESIKDRDAMQERWLSVYDSLNTDQKEKVWQFFKARMDRPNRVDSEKWGYGRERHYGQRGYGRHGG